MITPASRSRPGYKDRNVLNLSLMSPPCGGARDVVLRDPDSPGSPGSIVGTDGE